MNERRESGFNLIEVIVALALLAAVLLTISGLFIQGSQSVNTGRDLTEATSLATDILEQMDKWAFSQLYTNFCTSVGTAHVGSDTAFAFQSNWTTCTVFNAIPLAGANAAGASTGWQPKIDARLPNAKATVSVTPLGQSQFVATVSGVQVPCKGIRVQVTVDWVLKLKPRSVTLETVRF